MDILFFLFNLPIYLLPFCPPKVTQSLIDSSDMIRNSRFSHTRVSVDFQGPNSNAAYFIPLYFY